MDVNPENCNPDQKPKVSCHKGPFSKLELFLGYCLHLVICVLAFCHCRKKIIVGEMHFEKKIQGDLFYRLTSLWNQWRLVIWNDIILDKKDLCSLGGNQVALPVTGKLKWCLYFPLWHVIKMRRRIFRRCKFRHNRKASLSQRGFHPTSTEQCSQAWLCKHTQARPNQPSLSASAATVKAPLSKAQIASLFQWSRLDCGSTESCVALSLPLIAPAGLCCKWDSVFNQLIRLKKWFMRRLSDKKQHCVYCVLGGPKISLSLG